MCMHAGVGRWRDGWGETGWTRWWSNSALQGHVWHMAEAIDSQCQPWTCSRDNERDSPVQSCIRTRTRQQALVSGQAKKGQTCSGLQGQASCWHSQGFAGSKVGSSKGTRRKGSTQAMLWPWAKRHSVQSAKITSVRTSGQTRASACCVDSAMQNACHFSLSLASLNFLNNHIL